MKITLPGTFDGYRSFVSEELPRLVYQKNTDSKLGGHSVRTMLKTDRLHNWKILEDTPTSFEASVFLGKSSNKILTGFRRILIRAREEGQETRIELFSSNRAVAVTLVGLLFCLLPGIVVYLVKLTHDSFERKVMAQVGAEVKERYPQASLKE